MMSGAYQNFWQAAGASLFAPRRSRKERSGARPALRLRRGQPPRGAPGGDYAGISTEIMQQLLPLLAGILAGGMSQWMTAQAHAPNPSSSEEGAKDNTDGIDPWADCGQAGYHMPRRRRSRQPVEDMMASLLRMAPHNAAAARKRRPHRPRRDDGKGHEMQMQYLASLQSRSLNDAWKASGRNPEQLGAGRARTHSGLPEARTDRSPARAEAAVLRLRECRSARRTNTHDGFVMSRLIKSAFTSPRVSPISASIRSSNSARCIDLGRSCRALSEVDDARAN